MILKQKISNQGQIESKYGNFIEQYYERNAYKFNFSDEKSGKSSFIRFLGVITANEIDSNDE